MTEQSVRSGGSVRSVRSVRRWMPDGQTRIYTAAQVAVPLFVDDTVEKVLAKIALGIDQYHADRREDRLRPSLDHAPFAWHKSRVLRFDRPRDLAGLPANPWKMSQDERAAVPGASAQVAYREGDLVGDVQVLDVLFWSDAPDFIRQHPAFFPDARIEWKPPRLSALAAEAALLEEVWSQGEDGAGPAPALTRVRFVAETGTNWDLFALFEAWHASKEAPLLQLVQDAHHILYKLYDRHTIPTSTLQSWTQFGAAPKVASLQVFLPMGRRTQWAKLCVEESGNVVLSYRCDVRDNVRWAECEAHAHKVRAWAEARLKHKLAFRVNGVTAKTEVVVQSMSLQHVSKALGSLQPLFHVVKMQDGVLEVACKRSANYRSKLDIIDFIQSRVRLGSPMAEILEELQALGLSQEDIRLWHEQFLAAEEARMQGTAPSDRPAPRRKSLAQTGCMLHIGRSSTGFKVFVFNASSMEELERIAQWVRGALRRAGAALPPQAPTAPPARPRSSTSSAASSSSRRSAAAEDNLLDDGDLEFLGGALGKEYQRYFNSMLAASDPAVFLDTPLYSRKCAANNFRQPVVMSLEEKARLDKSAFKDAVDSVVTYGSDAQHQNAYMCPRIWCPMSRVPMTEEQLKEHGGKCPAPHFEKPMLLYEDKYWDNSPRTAKYIGFLSERSPKGFCLPCCMKKKMKDVTRDQCLAPAAPENVATNTSVAGPSKAPAAVANATDTTAPRGYKEDTYVMGAPAPLPADRYGALPEDLHHLLLPSVAHSTCSKSITSTACYVRRGIGLDDDSFTKALVAGLGMASKAELLKAIRAKLDPITFLSLENGHVLQAFRDGEAIDPAAHPGMVTEWRRWIKRWPGGAKGAEGARLSRELGIYRAYQNYLEHIRSSDPKNPQHFVDLLRRLWGVALVVWQKSGTSSAVATCPFFSDVQEVLAPQARVLMLLQEGAYVEPLEWKARGEQARALHPVESVRPVADLLTQACPVPEDNRVRHVVAVLRAIKSWCALMLSDPKAWEVREIVLGPDLSVYGLWTASRAMILLPPDVRGVLPDLVSLFAPKGLVYHEDIAGTVVEVRDVLAPDARMLASKLQSVGLGLAAAPKWVVPAPSPLVAPAVLLHGPIPKRQIGQRRTTSRWRAVELLVGRTLLAYWDTLVEPLLARPRADRIFTLMNTFPKIPDRAMVQAVLEELPMEDGKDALARHLRSMHLEARTRAFYRDDLRREGREWVFSQAAIQSGRHNDTLRPSQGPVPDAQHTPTKTHVAQPKDAAARQAPAGAPPAMLDASQVDVKELPSKFSKIRQYAWSEFRVWKRKEAAQGGEAELMAWLARQLEAPLTWEEVEYAYVQLAAKLLARREWAQPLLDDASFVAAWAHVLKKKFKGGDELWSALATMGADERRRLWFAEVFSKLGSGHVGKVHWYVASQLLGLHVLVLHRTKYGAAASGAPVARAALEDQSMSSLYFPADEGRPLIILYSDAAGYHAIVDKNKRFLHQRVEEMPKDVVDLLEFHRARAAPIDPLTRT
jgi:hypothetical protein